jgi:hypothetical protein
MRAAGTDDAGISPHHFFQFVHSLGGNRLVHMDNHVNNIHRITSLTPGSRMAKGPGNAFNFSKRAGF